MACLSLSTLRQDHTAPKWVTAEFTWNWKIVNWWYIQNFDHFVLTQLTWSFIRVDSVNAERDSTSTESTRYDQYSMSMMTLQTNCARVCQRCQELSRGLWNILWREATHGLFFTGHLCGRLSGLCWGTWKTPSIGHFFKQFVYELRVHWDVRKMWGVDMTWACILQPSFPEQIKSLSFVCALSIAKHECLLLYYPSIYPIPCVKKWP